MREAYYRGVDEAVFKGSIAGEQLAVEEGGILDVPDEGDVDGVGGGEVVQGNCFESHDECEHVNMNLILNPVREDDAVGDG